MVALPQPGGAPDETSNSGLSGSLPQASLSGVTAIIPAYNEAESVADTIRSLQMQTVPPVEIIVVDDCSEDETSQVARSLGVTVLRPGTNTGSKAGAQTFALPHVRTEFTMVLDADTMLAPDALANVMPVFADAGVAAACGFVVPRVVRSVWERGRYVEYLFAFSFYKQVQDYYKKPLISSGCFSVYRTTALRQMGGWSMRTMAEDMDLTWSLYEAGWKVRFVPGAISYPIEPTTFNYMRKQLNRWSHAFVQNVKLHWGTMKGNRFLRLLVGVMFAEASCSSAVYLIVLPVLAVFFTPKVLWGYLIDAPALLVPILAAARSRGEVGRALASFPAFFVLRLVNGFFMLKALWLELIRKQSLTVYEKGH